MEGLEETRGLELIRYIFHREHEHPLILSYWTETEGREGSCRSCKEPPSGLTYSCSRCGFYIHKICTGNPDAVGSPLHHHPLTRDFCTGSVCSQCDSTYDSRSNFYKCSECDFCLDQKCALVLPSSWKHGPDGPSCQLCHSTLIEQEEDDEENRCIVCHGCCSGPTYSCPPCNFFLHKSCSSGPAEIQHPAHPFHPLKRIEMRMFKCHSCLEVSYGTSYRCEECDFNLDFKCAFLMPRKEFEGRETILMDFHRHPLALTDESTRRNQNDDCIVCYEPCPRSSYGCRVCEFYVNVHRSCASAKVPEVLHSTRFHYRPLKRSHVSGFTCNACQKYRSGLCYASPDLRSNLKFDVRCAYLEQPLIVFDGHSHPLIFLEDFDGCVTCDACGEPCTESVFHCPTCDIKLHMSCGPLPCSIKLEIHFHDLVLKDSLVEDLTGDEEFYCHCCEERRDPHEFVYYCSRCNYCAEIKCVMSELKQALLGKSGDVELRTLGRWNQSGKLLSKGLVSEEMQQCDGTGPASTEPKPGCWMKDITGSLTEAEENELDNIFNSNGTLFEDLSGDGDRIQDARPYSDEEFLHLVQRLDSAQIADLKKSWRPGTRFVYVREHLVPEQFLRVYDDLYRKYGDLSAETTLSPGQKALLFLSLCQAVEGICTTKVVDVTEGELVEWWISIKAVSRAGFKVGFAIEALRTVVLAYYGLLFRSNLEEEIRSLEDEIPKNKTALETLQGKLKFHKEYFESKEPSLVKKCMEEASLRFMTAGEVVLL